MIALARAELLKLRSTRTALGLFIVILLVTLLPLVLQPPQPALQPQRLPGVRRVRGLVLTDHAE